MTRTVVAHEEVVTRITIFTHIVCTQERLQVGNTIVVVLKKEEQHRFVVYSLECLKFGERALTICSEEHNYFTVQCLLKFNSLFK